MSVIISLIDYAIHLTFNLYLLNTYYVQGSVLNVNINHAVKGLTFMEFMIQQGKCSFKKTNKQTKLSLGMGVGGRVYARG